MAAPAIPALRALVQHHRQCRHGEPAVLQSVVVAAGRSGRPASWRSPSRAPRAARLPLCDQQGREPTRRSPEPRSLPLPRLPQAGRPRNVKLAT